MNELRNQAKDIYDIIYPDSTVRPESVVARVLNYCLKRDEEVRKETAKEYYNKVAQEIELHNFENTYDYDYMSVCNKEILSEFGVEVEE